MSRWQLEMRVGRWLLGEIRLEMEILGPEHAGWPAFGGHQLT